MSALDISNCNNALNKLTLSEVNSNSNKSIVPDKKRKRKPRWWYRRNKSNVSNNAPPPPAPPPISNPVKKKNSRKMVKKSISDFKCTGEKCRKTWTSVHAWPIYEFTCEFCESKAKVVEFEDEMCVLDNYECATCNNHWQSIHDEGINQQLCDMCDDTIVNDGRTQNRFGRHFWYKCMNPECHVEWEDFYQGKIYSQRCKTCFSDGEMLRTRKNLSPKEVERRRGRGGFGIGGGGRRGFGIGGGGRRGFGIGGGGRRGFGMGGGGHDVDGCDMCQTIRNQGFGHSCLRKKLVIFELEVQHDGSILENILEALP